MDAQIFVSDYEDDDTFGASLDFTLTMPLSHGISSIMQRGNTILGVISRDYCYFCFTDSMNVLTR